MAGTKRPRILRPVCPDKIDLRDRPYQPALQIIPKAAVEPAMKLPVMHQGESNACTGFALANFVNQLTMKRDGKKSRVSPWMLYSMARRYDEFPGSGDTGSSLRGAMKGWYRHGACREDLWPGMQMPPASDQPEQDWWQDAVTRPLGAYYRVDARSVTDLHVAINELGAVYASAICHSGWMKGFDAGAEGMWEIPVRKASPSDGGHAFLIVGYDRSGFIVHNSWGEDWGAGGLARLRYEDWSENAMDAWVAQLGVVTDQRNEIASSVSLRTVSGRVHVAAEATLRDHEISPFVVDMENNGTLSGSGRFRTNPGDLDALFDVYLKDAAEKWRVKAGGEVDVAIYAHGGLTNEDSAAETAARWVPALFEARIFPVFFMWETDLWSTLKNRLADVVEREPRATGSLGEQMRKWWNQRLERALAPLGSVIWGEMKQNAEAISKNEQGGGSLLYQSAQRSAVAQKYKLRLHLIGHSAGTIVHSHLVDELAQRGWTFESVSFLAAAVRTDVFKAKVVPHLKSGAVKRFRSFHLSDTAEQKDPTCRPILGYGRSLLYLVSESFERGVRTPILGMEKYFGSLSLPNAEAYESPGAESASTTHGDFDNDELTMRNVIGKIRAGS